MAKIDLELEAIKTLYIFINMESDDPSEKFMTDGQGSWEHFKGETFQTVSKAKAKKLQAAYEEYQNPSYTREQRLEFSRFGPSVTLTMDTSTFEFEGSKCLAEASGEISVYGEDDPIKVGSIDAFRAMTWVGLDAIAEAADYIDRDIYNAFDWLRSSHDEIDIASSTIILLNRVELDPEWRNMGLALPATAKFLELFSAEAPFVFCKPFPPGGFKLGKEACDRRAAALQRYWSRLGLNHYEALDDGDGGYQFAYEWASPKSYLKET